MKTPNQSDRINLAHARMAPDDGNGGGGGEQNQEQQNESGGEAQQGGEQQKKPTVEDKLDQLLTRMDQQDRVTQALVQRITGSGEQRQQRQEQEEDDPTEDPKVRAAMAKATAAERRAMMIADRQDREAYLRWMQDEGVDEETAEAALQVHQHWLKKGINFVDGMPPSRIDAARYYIGATFKQRMNSHNQQQNRQNTRNEENRHAQLENSGGGGGGGYRAEYPDNFDKLPITKQSELIGKELDKKFPNGW